MPTNVLANLMSSEKGVMALLVVLSTTILTAMGRIDPTTSQWLEYSTYWLGIYTGGKTIQGAAVSIANRSATSTTSETSSSATKTTGEVVGSTKTSVVSTTVANDRKTESGVIDPWVMACGAITALVMVAIIGIAACSSMKGEGKALLGGVVDCTKASVAAHVKEFRPMGSALIANSIENGKVNWGPIRDVAQGFTTEVGRCVFADAISRLLAPPTPGAPRVSPVDVDAAATRDGFRKLADELYHGQAFQTDTGLL